MNPVDQYIAVCAQAAQRLGLQHVVAGARDPKTGAIKIVTSTNAVDYLRDAVAEKFGISSDDDLNGSVTSWPSG